MMGAEVLSRVRNAGPREDFLPPGTGDDRTHPAGDVAPHGAATGSRPLILDPRDPLPSARAFVEKSYLFGELVSLRHQGGVFYAHSPDTNAYQERDESSVRAEIYKFLEPATVVESAAPFKPTKRKVEDVLDALRAVCHTPTSWAPPRWLDDRKAFDPFDILPCRNGLLHIPTRTVLPATPAFFTLNGLDFAYDPRAPRPERWHRFLSELFEADCRSAETLQEWMGYLLTPRTHFQKIMMIVGPRRSGKGTISRVTRRLLGERNVCGPTLANMGEQFGLTILIGKSAAMVSDARISGRTDTAVISERLLSISGEDALSVPRKYLPDWNGRLATRFTLMTNELPRVEDSSGALSSRFLVLTLSNSFHGKEDSSLFDSLLPELPGILNWALEGWHRLYARGRFVQPAAAQELIQQFEDLGSPIGAFLRDCCEVGPGYEVLQQRLFEAWKRWCEKNGREKPGTIQLLGRNLHAAVPSLKITQPRIDGDRFRHWKGVRLRD